ncbi:MAG: formate C-acetyltransferase/glycerol dehydratase family glycyl radical enzyme [Holdemanella sp.]|nr:formate C-acetyltransferase/glycerol dehydratase family glycyl radical enzyme [Holdemanella sp.]
MLSKRCQTIKDEMLSPKRVVDLERAILYTESHKMTEGEPTIIRRAKALQHILENHEIIIDDYDLLVGNRTRKPRAGVLSPEMSPYWIFDEIDDFETRPQDTFTFSKEDKEYYKNYLYPYWAGRSLKDYYDSHVDESVNIATKSKIFAINQTDKGQGHIIPDFELLLNNGFKKVLDMVKEKDNGNDFYKASIITLEASIQYILRYKKEVDIKIESCIDETRRNELKEISGILEKIAYEKPDTLYEAIQLLWLFCVILQHESNASSISLGRLDQYLYPFYLKENDSVFMKELMDCFYLKTNTIVFIRSKESAKFFAGFPSGYTVCVGGLNEEGNDASNALSTFLLELHEDIGLPQPNLSVRMHESIDNTLLKTACETIRLGNGLPQIFGDEVNIHGFVNRGISLKDARDYAVVGCVELSIPGKMYGLHDIAMFNLLKCMEVTMKEHRDGFDTYDEFKEEIKKTISKYIQYMVVGSNACDLAHRYTSPIPLLSTFMDGCIEKGKDVTEGGTIYNFSGVQGIGCPNLSDSLYVMKKAIWDEKVLSYSRLLTILENNWEGEEILRQSFINKYVKYGNDNDEVDTLGAELLTFYNEEVSKYDNVRNGKFQPGSYTVSAHIPLGEKVGATADGRMAGEQLADGGLSPMVGRDKFGPTASLLSVSKLDNHLTTNGSLLNVKFSPATLKGDDGIFKLMAYIKAFDRLRIQHIQFNVQSRETLIDAQLHPENHKDLVVRVAGYSAMFIELSKMIQDDIINRSEHIL